uniref:Uncharacterized protein n=1 Tax=Ditylenchus dipsaci TaxID=166011 RepID=A0A915E288_9BILA
MTSNSTHTNYPAPIDWPPRSPYLTPINFFGLWGYVKSKVYTAHPYETIEELVAKIVKVIEEMPQEIVESAMTKYRIERDGVSVETY